MLYQKPHRPHVRYFRVILGPFLGHFGTILGRLLRPLGTGICIFEVVSDLVTVAFLLEFLRRLDVASFHGILTEVGTFRENEH